MNAQLISEKDAESKAASKVWIAVCVDVMAHEVVGAHVPAPRPDDPSRQAWQPLVMWLYLLKEAAWRDRKRVIKGRAIALRRGELAVSERYLAREANWGRKAVRVFIERLEKFGMVAATSVVADPDLDRASLKRGPLITVLTICNYDAYQNATAAKGPTRAQQGPSRGPRHYNKKDAHQGMVGSYYRGDLSSAAHATLSPFDDDDQDWGAAS